MAEAHVPAVTGRDRPFRGWRIVGALAVTQTVGYGVLFYSFAVVLGPMSQDLGLPATTASGSLTVALLVCAAVSVPVGRWLDRHGGRALLISGSVAGTVLVAAWSQVDNALQLYLVLAGIGLVSAMVLYEAAFAVVIPWFHAGRTTALLAITIVAGFASTIFMPLTGLLTQRYDWRTALLALAVIHGAITIPLHLLIRRPSDLGQHPDGADRPPPAADGPLADRASVLRAAARDPFSWTLGLSLVAHSLTLTMLGVHLVAYLVDLGHTGAFAATATGLLGVLSVTGRLLTTAAARRFTLTAITAAIFTLQAAATLALPLLGGTAWGAVGCVLGIGLGFGIVNIVKPALLAAQYGTAAFATLSGAMIVPMTLAKALGPLAAAALLAATGSYTQVMITAAVLLTVSAAAALAAGRHHRPQPSSILEKR
ncbi:MFS transporter [Actinocorallia populi]|uniref:MFS transporter n=1 Tax=Actinocorallia populi TaxID=2079200 RepID=UPI000D08770E|nr:MFS transporter [Actinocorallia populi]